MNLTCYTLHCQIDLSEKMCLNLSLSILFAPNIPPTEKWIADLLLQNM